MGKFTFWADTKFPKYMSHTKQLASSWRIIRDALIFISQSIPSVNTLPRNVSFVHSDCLKVFGNTGCVFTVL